MNKSFLKFLLSLFSVGMLLLSALRFGFFCYYFSEIKQAATTDVWLAFAIGLIMDSNAVAGCLLLCFLICLPIQFFTPNYRKVFLLFFNIGLSTITFTNLVDIFYFKQYGTRLNALATEVVDHAQVVLPMLYSEYPLIKILFIATGLIVIIIYTNAYLFKKFESKADITAKNWWGLVSITVLFALTFLYYGPPLWNLTSFSASGMLNQMSSNGIYNLLKSIHQKSIYQKDLTSYAQVSDSVATLSVKQLTVQQDEQTLSNAFPTLRKSQYNNSQTRKHVVVILVESFSASNIGILKGKPRTPAFDAWAKKGVLFSKCYANGTRTQNGLTSVVAGFPSVLGNSMIRRKGVNEFSTMANIFFNNGYKTQFIHGGDITYDDMDLFLKQGGFAEISDVTSFKNWRFKNKWGVCDEDLFDHALPKIWSPQKPTLSVILTVSNHAPHDVPEYFAKTHPEINNMSHAEGTFYYTDYCIGKFLDKCAQNPNFNNTLFLIIADHGEVYQPKDHQYKIFHIPALLLNTNQQQGVYSNTCSQSDFTTTITTEAGIKTPYHYIGQYLFSPNFKPFAISRQQDPVVYINNGKRVFAFDLRNEKGLFFTPDSLGYIAVKADDDQSQADSMITFTKNYLQGLNIIYTQGKYQFRN